MVITEKSYPPLISSIPWRSDRTHGRAFTDTQSLIATEPFSVPLRPRPHNRRRPIHHRMREFLMLRRARVLASAAAAASLLMAGAGTYAAGARSIERANVYVNAQDWNGLLRYSIEWTQTEPNAPMAWFYLGNTYGQALNQPQHALPAFERAVALQPK